jgi:glycosyltransferase involved in cell wall biosynthesis
VLPSDSRETWGLVVNEAMASGLPSIVSDACGCGEDLVEPLGAGFRFRHGDTESLSNSLRLVLSSPPARSCLEKQIERFDLSTTVETVRNLYWSYLRRESSMS